MIGNMILRSLVGAGSIPGLHLGSDSESSSIHFGSSAEWESSEELDNTLTPEGKSHDM